MTTQGTGLMIARSTFANGDTRVVQVTDSDGRASVQFTAGGHGKCSQSSDQNGMPCRTIPIIVAAAKDAMTFGPRETKKSSCKSYPSGYNKGCRT